jgi:hypothetical protein
MDEDDAQWARPGRMLERKPWLRLERIGKGGVYYRVRRKNALVLRLRDASNYDELSKIGREKRESSY